MTLEFKFEDEAENIVGNKRSLTSERGEIFGMVGIAKKYGQSHMFGT
ncbi:hypothetical protein EV697_10178 [Bisgaardia hudsonensis]|uniref:Uncharacterized protein n=1 Tax=Bisgaardia hudsonensis TaxID=109472 RepID=A0A4R2N288_9PAST|nr:hypothetical protein [Bisgaardia hudsonensis]TCP13961.1 hypothetical protein EV697_10178 [Bisgaardia hudsonensis]